MSDRVLKGVLIGCVVVPFLAIGFTLQLASPAKTPDPPPPSNAAFFQVLADTGCYSKNSPQLKADLWKEWVGKKISVSGMINGFRKDGIGIKILDGEEAKRRGMNETWTSDVDVEYANPRDFYSLQDKSYITVVITITGPTDCILPLRGRAS